MIEENKKNLENFLFSVHPTVMKSRLVIIGLYITTYESMIETLIDNLKMFFCDDLNYKENFKTESFKKNVIKLDPNSLSRASMLFVKSNDGINDDDYNEFLEIKRLRDDFAHHLIDNLLGNFSVEKIALSQNKLIELCVKIEKWWFVFFEVSVSDEELTQDQLDGMITSNQMIFKLLTDVALGDDETAMSYYNNIKKEALAKGYISIP